MTHFFLCFRREPVLFCRIALKSIVAVALLSSISILAQSTSDWTDGVYGIDVVQQRFKLGDRISLTITGTTGTLQRITHDLTKAVLFIDGIPLRGLATNAVIGVNSLSLTNISVDQKVVSQTNYERVIHHAQSTNVPSRFRSYWTTNTFVTNRLEWLTNKTVLTNLSLLTVDFLLDRNDGNRREWINLMGSPRARSKAVFVGMGMETTTPAQLLGIAPQKPELVLLPDKPFLAPKGLRWSAAIIMMVLCIAALIRIGVHSGFGGTLQKSWSWVAWAGVMSGAYLCFGATICWAVFASLFLVGFIFLARYTEILRDSGPQPPPKKHRTYSLARFQMAVWFFLVICSYVFIWLITGSLDTITSTVLALMGIGAGTALGAETQNSSKISKLKARRDELAKKAELTKEERCELADLERLTMDVHCLEEEKKTIEVKIRQLAQPPPTDPLVNQQLAELSARLQRIIELLASRPVSQGFFEDVLTDEVGISFHRFQMFVWTIVLAIIFIASVYESLAMPEFNGTLLALMGISSGTYLGFMISEPRP